MALIDTIRTYFQCECDNPAHVEDAMSRYKDLVDDPEILKDTATMIITADGGEALCQCAYCGWDKVVDISLLSHPVAQHGKGFWVVGKHPDA